VRVVEARDPWFAGHDLRVAQLAAAIAVELGRTYRSPARSSSRSSGTCWSDPTFWLRCPICVWSARSSAVTTSAGTGRATPMLWLERRFHGEPD
jgi:hypothetical protein